MINLLEHHLDLRGSVPVDITRGFEGTTPLPIGQCRARVIEYDSGTVGTVEAKYKVYLFDIRMFTFLTLSDTPSATLVDWCLGINRA